MTWQKCITGTSAQGHYPKFASSKRFVIWTVRTSAYKAKMLPDHVYNKTRFFHPKTLEVFRPPQVPLSVDAASFSTPYFMRGIV